MVSHHDHLFQGEFRASQVVLVVKNLPAMQEIWVWSLGWASLVAQGIESPPAMQEAQVRSQGLEDPWRRKWQPTPVFLLEESHGQRSLVGYSPWGCKKSDITEHWCPHLVQNGCADMNHTWKMFLLICGFLKPFILWGFQLSINIIFQRMESQSQLLIIFNQRCLPVTSTPVGWV